MTIPQVAQFLSGGLVQIPSGVDIPGMATSKGTGYFFFAVPTAEVNHSLESEVSFVGKRLGIKNPFLRAGAVVITGVIN